jgi:excisionase family DNA binding protein
MEAKRFTKVSDYAKRLGIHPATVRRAIHAGTIPAIRLTPRGAHLVDDDAAIVQLKDRAEA